MEGGLIVTDDQELYHILVCLRAHGWTRQLPKDNSIATKSDDPFEESFKFLLPGYNVRPVEMSGAIGIEQLKNFQALLSKEKRMQFFSGSYFKMTAGLLSKGNFPKAAGSVSVLSYIRIRLYCVRI
ncbi:DegT/DnrJ/EryC1/StrS family aminotransferase [Niabella hibiscisoli]|uniref:DegT/DnrJ/EryC1/StrS family aminotransferase n=1 Tax=Niabella hibiscisoli TaxID=1825928 RepID=UPI0021D46E36